MHLKEDSHKLQEVVDSQDTLGSPAVDIPCSLGSLEVDIHKLVDILDDIRRAVDIQDHLGYLLPP